MLAILIMGLIAGPAVSLYGSPTVSPVTEAAWASERVLHGGRSELHLFGHFKPPLSIVARLASVVGSNPILCSSFMA